MNVSKERLNNFSAGPAVLPLSVLEAVRENLFNYQGTGIGIMEMSHRSAPFEEIIQTAEKDLRELLGMDDSYAVLFTTGGATNQNSMVPMNLLGKGQTADYLVTGYWAERAMKEATKFGTIHVAGTSKDREYSYIPTEIKLSQAPAYVHFTSNNTIYGTQFSAEPEVGRNVLVCDASSDLLCRWIEIEKYGLVYAGAQKNLGTAGVTIVMMKRDLLSRTPANLPVLMDYNTYVKDGSMFNTPPTFSIYVSALVFKWIKQEGGLKVIEERNRKKAAILYQAIDSSEFFRGTAEKSSRSLMNITFRLPSEELEKRFIKEAESAGFSGLKGHRNVGGMRASIYNAFPAEGVTELTQFMKDFERRAG